MDVLVFGKRRNELFRLLLRRLFGKVVAEGTDARLLARPDLVADIHLRSGVVPDEYNGKPDLLAVFFFKCLRAEFEFCTDLCRNGFSVDELHWLMIPPSTPLTKLAEFSVEYLRASPAASLTETTAGTSSTYLISASASKRIALSAM